MLRLVLALLAGFAVMTGGVALVGESYPGLLGTALVAMFVTAALAPHVFIRGDWPSRKSDRAGHS